MATVAFSGGEKLAKYLAEMAEKSGNAKAVNVGFMSGATYPDKNNTPVAMVAAIQNYGAPAKGIPPRPFFSNMVADKSPEWGEQLGKVWEAQGHDAKATLGSMGMLIKGQLQASIRETNAPPLSAATIAQKGFAKPLIDTGHMLNSVDYEVIE